MGNKASSIKKHMVDSYEKTKFKLNTTNNCKSTKKGGCDHIKRIMYCMKYYQQLDLENNHKHKQDLVTFCKEEYVLLIDDYIHLTTKHYAEVNDITNKLISELNIPCDFVQCSAAIRYDNREREIINDADLDEPDDEFVFYRTLLDTAHCYLYHLQDFALRVNIDDNIAEQKSGDPHFDAVFDQILTKIHEKKNTLKCLNRFNLGQRKHNKFNIGVDSKSVDDAHHVDEKPMDEAKRNDEEGAAGNIFL